MRVRLNDGVEYEGSAKEILEQMKSKSMFTDAKTIDEYLDFLVENARKFEGKTLAVAGGTTEERAAALLAAFKAAGLAEEIA